MHRTFLRSLIVLVVAALLAPLASAQDANLTTPTSPAPPQGWQESKNEFGTGQALYQDLIDGSPRAFEARFYLTTHYTEKGVTYFLFALDTQRTPLRATFDALENGETGESISIYKQETEIGGKLEKWFVDIANMPPPGTLIVLRGTMHAQGLGQYQAGALLQPFNYKWEGVAMSSGTPASLYVGTQYGVNAVTEKGCDGALCGASNVLSRFAPPAALGLALAAVAVAAVAARRRRS